MSSYVKHHFKSEDLWINSLNVFNGDYKVKRSAIMPIFVIIDSAANSALLLQKFVCLAS